MSDLPTNCQFCGAIVAILEDGEKCVDHHDNWVTFECLSNWHRGYSNQRRFQSDDCSIAERDRLYKRVEKLEEAGDAMMVEPCEYTFEKWIQSKEAKL